MPQLTLVGSVLLRVMALGKPSIVRLTDVYYAPMLARNIFSYGKLELKGYGLDYTNDRRAIRPLSTGDVVFDVAMQSNVLVVEVQAKHESISKAGSIVASIIKVMERGEDVQRATVMHSHQRLGSLSYNTIKRMALEPGSGIQLTGCRRMVCVMRAKSKQTKNAQSNKLTRARTSRSIASDVDLLGY
ncbi:uncharacterized protein PHALS_10917 [Plasmopara halstedii]|uniref:Uncharacterized protein n=1 Tax=Plasmopara halstedii TaxID=4781 RepID=A0A0P1AHU1_PLAHL|nr:uncharacterized protein PHALS_10917 [Plasmopara halstedii]CEG40733.1 hypothetical protein PHALS_10917 [Plasmopara halstedii]|eukprot:XP_024577102.1 hypothetical protein PHALS_10917 [Plasmopara halstedii]